MLHFIKGGGWAVNKASLNDGVCDSGRERDRETALERDKGYQEKTRQAKGDEQDNWAQKGEDWCGMHSCHASDMLLLSPPGLFWYKKMGRLPMSLS